jgi:flagellar hook-associated protein FlgK
MPSTFSSYYVARSGIQTAQYNLKVTGQNIANVNTDGYTRQRVDSSALASTGNNMRYVDRSNLGIGEGVESTGVSQMRDPFLDVRYRLEHTKTGLTSTQLGTLNDLESVFDETLTDGINSQFEDLVKQLNTLAASPSNTGLENIVKNSSLLLTKAFNSAASQLSEIRDQQTKAFNTDAVDKVNTILKNIAHINQEIKSADVAQTPALELEDQRNSMLDELSQYVNIQVSTKQVSVGSGRTVDELQVDLVSDADGTKYNLISNDKYSQFSTKQDVEVSYSTENGNVYNTKDLNMALYLTDSNGNKLGRTDVDGTTILPLNDDIASGEFGGYLSMLNDSGEYDAVASHEVGTPPDTEMSPAVTATTRGIGYYEKTLDKLASEFAKMMNNANSTNITDINDSTTVPNKPLFTTDDGTTTTGITAANISISDAWNRAAQSSTGFITATKEQTLPGVDNSAAGQNILYMITQFDAKKAFTTDPNDATSGTTLFSGSINTFMSDMTTTLGLDINTISNNDGTYSSTLNEIDTQRQALSSVDVNEEGINMIMYNQALTAASRFMTTMDEAIDTIINKMGVI